MMVRGGGGAKAKVVDSPGTALLDLCDVELEKAVEPLNELLSIEGESG
jgi:hypothetical protein